MCFACAEILPEPKASRVALVAGWESPRLWPQALRAMSVRGLPRLLLRQWRPQSHRPSSRWAEVVEARQEADHLAMAAESLQLQQQV